MTDISPAATYTVAQWAHTSGPAPHPAVPVHVRVRKDSGDHALSAQCATCFEVLTPARFEVQPVPLATLGRYAIARALACVGGDSTYAAAQFDRELREHPAKAYWLRRADAVLALQDATGGNDFERELAARVLAAVQATHRPGADVYDIADHVTSSLLLGTPEQAGETEHPCGDYPAPCNCENPQTHDREVTA